MLDVVLDWCNTMIIFFCHNANLFYIMQKRGFVVLFLVLLHSLLKILLCLRRGFFGTCLLLWRYGTCSLRVGYEIPIMLLFVSSIYVFIVPLE